MSFSYYWIPSTELPAWYRAEVTISPGAQATSGFVLSLSLPDILADDAEEPS